MRESLFTNSLRRVTSGPFTGCVKPRSPQSLLQLHLIIRLPCCLSTIFRKAGPGFCRSALAQRHDGGGLVTPLVLEFDPDRNQIRQPLGANPIGAPGRLDLGIDGYQNTQYGFRARR